MKIFTFRLLFGSAWMLNAFHKKSAVLLDNNLEETGCLVSPQIEISSNKTPPAAHVTWQQPIAILQRLKVIPEWIFSSANQTAWYIPLCSSQKLPNPSSGLSSWTDFLKQNISNLRSLSCRAVHLHVGDYSEELLRQLSYAIKNQLGHTRGFGTEKHSRNISCWFFIGRL